MTLLTAARNTPMRENADLEEHPVKGGMKLYQGALVCLDAGWAVPGRAGVNLVTIGCAQNAAAPVADGGDTVRVRRGVHRYANSSGADQVTRAAIGKPVYVVDDQTVALTDGAGTRSVAGKARDVDAQGVWIET